MIFVGGVGSFCNVILCCAALGGGGGVSQIYMVDSVNMYVV
jgi:hypothetical protein